jgi:hypothetical protein
MIHLFVNVLAASAGGGLTYVRNILPQFSMRDNVKVSVLLSPPLRGQMANYRNVVLIEREPPRDVAARFWFEQRHLPALIRQSGADVLLSAGNFALWNSPIPLRQSGPRRAAAGERFRMVAAEPNDARARFVRFRFNHCVQHSKEFRDVTSLVSIVGLSGVLVVYPDLYDRIDCGGGYLCDPTI